MVRILTRAEQIIDAIASKFCKEKLVQVPKIPTESLCIMSSIIVQSLVLDMLRLKLC